MFYMRKQEPLLYAVPLAPALAKGSVAEFKFWWKQRGIKTSTASKPITITKKGSVGRCQIKLAAEVGIKGRE